MRSFIMLTRLISEEVSPSFAIRKKAGDISEKVKIYCPEVKWVKDYAILGPWDYLDIFEAPDWETAIKVSAIVRYYAGAHTEIWSALPWGDFEDTLQELSGIMEKD